MRCPVVISVEDDDGSYAVLRELLQEAYPDVRVERARNGSEALKKLNSMAQDPSVEVRLVLLDVRLPGMSGFEILTAVRDNESLRRVPIVVLTGKAEEADRLACLENGAQDYLEKPWDLQGLENVLIAACVRAGL
jgi:CheY-like chemotaxis protein